MTEYKDREEALKSLETNNMSFRKKETLAFSHSQYLSGYAAICEFLSSTNDFQSALEKISMRLWSAYRRDTSRSNKFTRALSVVAGQNGFRVGTNQLPTVKTSSPMRFKLTGADKGLGYFLRNHFFWKDSMEAQHGEHSHSLQWLAIAAAKLGTTVPITELYARSCDFAMSTTDRELCLAWAWVADCFPTSMSAFGDATVLKQNKDNLTTTSYRSPQNIMHFLLPADGPIDGHFVSNYLFQRYSRRGWFKSEPGKFGGSIGGISKAKSLEKNGVWEQSGRVESRLIRRNDADPRTGLGPADDKKLVGVEDTFHGVTGKLYMG